ncbi:leucine-rich repeat-containing protein [Leishmania donovani]|uniref:Leucine Rich repeat family protein n=1 Tax=Leishmania donovani TaxID=5661 RepID=A0A504X919_LEIDO|nr:Leucine Rich repeat family protein [Leishmania donovani]CAJ1988323.1 leucine-rich repeat-containing protein [Leishmania donovani]
MGCDASCLRCKKGTEEGKRDSNVVGSDSKVSRGASAAAFQRSYSEESLEIPVPDCDESLRQRSAADDARDSAAKGARSASTNIYVAEDPNLTCPAELRTIMDNMDLSSISTSSSAPQLFHMSPTERAEVETGTWAWWRQELRNKRVTKDGYHRVQLQDVHTRLTTQHEDNPSTVELDFSSCYMEPTAPYVLGRLFASLQLKELRWITSLRLDGNYFTDDGFGTMLATMSAANEDQTILPLLRQLYLNNMNLDQHSVAGLFAYLFPVDHKAMSSISQKKAFHIAGSPASRPSEAYIAASRRGPKVPLFPSLNVLSLSDNPGVGAEGLIQILRSLLAVHYEPHTVSVMDLSRCGLDRATPKYFREYFEKLSRAMKNGCYPVVPRRFVLIGNQHGIAHLNEIYSPHKTGVQLVL